MSVTEIVGALWAALPPWTALNVILGIFYLVSCHE